ncbi:alpha/beta hydrolase [Streptomyces inusitatus]|uniref:Alpha/beta hydrolase n=1 Tax=Streptomyces inusitatus TaxID=68221 RepID=A0A918PR13_9ACTN|nr:alpha/beta hydrolase [Streptomyces inusitatus]GGZ18805.1 alpha/beta hydrolase [Streptomyces inusitatus]
MAHRALPPWRGRTEERETTPAEGEVRLGRAHGGRAAARSGADPAVSGVVLLLPDGERESVRGTSARSLLRLLPLGRALARAGRADGLVVHSVHYRRRGWNGADAQLAADALRAADEVVRRYGDVPICLAGHGFGGRAALHAADHPGVGAVLAMAPWLPDDGAGGGARGGGAGALEPVKQLAGRQVLIVHGTNDARTEPDLSYRLAERAKKVNRNICRFEVHTDGNSLRQHHAEVMALATDFVLGSLFPHPYSRPVADALAAPPPLGLRMPLAAGFGKSLRP